MCNPVWTMVASPSTLTVSIDPDDDAAVAGSVMTAVGGGSPRKTVIGPGDFPLRLSIDAGTTHVVTVQVASVGRAANVTVTSEVSGSDSRGPDTCRLEVDENHPVAIDTIMVAGE